MKFLRTPFYRNLWRREIVLKCVKVYKYVVQDCRSKHIESTPPKLLNQKPVLVNLRNILIFGLKLNAISAL